MTHKALLLVSLGGSGGAIARYLLVGLAHRCSPGNFPVGTLLVNVLGCLATGAMMGWLDGKVLLGHNLRWLIVIGFLGSFTTFSALGYETFAMLKHGHSTLAAMNAIGNFGLGIGAVLLGHMIARTMAA